MRTLLISLALSLSMLTPLEAQYVYVNNNLSSGNVVTGYRVNADGTLTPLNSQFLTGGNDGLCFDIGSIVVSPSRTYLYASNYSSGNVAAFHIESDGSLTPVAGSPFAMNNPPGAVARASGIAISADGKFLTVGINCCGAGTGGVDVFSIAADGSLSHVNEFPFNTAGNVGYDVLFDRIRNNVISDQNNDRVGVMHMDSSGMLSAIPGSPFTTLTTNNHKMSLRPQGDFLFVSGGANGNVRSYRIGDDGSLTSAGLGSVPLAIGNVTHPSGNYVYVSGLGIYGFSISSSGTLSPLPNSPWHTMFDSTYGIAIDDTGKFLFGLDADQLASFRIASDGTLAPIEAIQLTGNAPCPCGIVFVGPKTIPTTTSIADSSITYGEDGAVTITVSAPTASNAPSGDVSLSVNGGTAVAQPLSSPVGTSASSVFTLPKPTAGTYSLAASFAAQNGFDASSATGLLTVNQATPIITWTTPAAIGEGTPLSSTQLNAAANVAGTFSYSPAAGTVLSVGTHTLTAIFTPADSANYSTATATVNIIVQSSQTITFAAIPNHIYGDPPFTVGATASSGLAVSFSANGNCVVNGNTITISGAGFCTITAAQAGNSVYLAAPNVQQSFDIAKATPILSWAALASIVYGTPLSGIQLHATASVPGNFTYSPAGGTLLNVGQNAISATFTPIDTADYVSGGVVTNSITVTQYPAVTTVTTSSQYPSQQYSDPVTLTAMITPAAIGGYAPAGSVTFYADSQVVGTAPLQTNGSGGLVANILLGPFDPMAPGSHTIAAVFNNVNANFSVTNPAKTVTINPEDARVTYTGAFFVGTGCVTCDTATVTLSTTIQDISAVTGDPAYDAYPGDVRNAKVTFINRDSGAIIASNLPVGLVDSSDTRTGTATYNWNVHLGTQSSLSFTVGIIVTNYYTRNSSADDAVITVSVPLTTNFITGGGYLVLKDSAGAVGGITGSNNNFGFNVKYNSGGTNLQGNLNLIVRSNNCVQGLNCSNRGPYVYQIKSNSMTSLSILMDDATFNGKANIKDITNPLTPISIDGNVMLQVVMTGNQSPGTNNTIGITVWNKSGGMWFSSEWSGTRTLQQNLAGGALVIH